MKIKEDDYLCITASKASHRLLMLHGWGADAEDLIPLGKELIYTQKFPIELVSLNAPHINPQGPGRQWYSLFPPAWVEVPEAIEELQIRLRHLPNSLIPLEKTIVLGFSQGAAMALDTCCEMPFAGIICCSGYPHPTWVPAKEQPPLLLTHGLRDNVVPFEATEKIAQSLEKSLCRLELQTFDGGHEIPPELFPKLRKALEDWFGFQ